MRSNGALKYLGILFCLLLCGAIFPKNCAADEDDDGYEFTEADRHNMEIYNNRCNVPECKTGPSQPGYYIICDPIAKDQYGEPLCRMTSDDEKLGYISASRLNELRSLGCDVPSSLSGGLECKGDGTIEGTYFNYLTFDPAADVRPGDEIIPPDFFDFNPEISDEELDNFISESLEELYRKNRPEEEEAPPPVPPSFRPRYQPEND